MKSCEKVLQEIQSYLAVPICQVVLGIVLRVQQMAVALVMKQEPDTPLTTMKEFHNFFKIEDATNHYHRGRAFLKCPQLLLVDSPDNVIDYEERFLLLDEDVDFYHILVQSCQRHLQGIHGLNGDVEFFFRVGGMEESLIEMTLQQAYQVSVRN